MKKIFISMLLVTVVVLFSGCAFGGYGMSKYSYNSDGTFTAENGKEYDSIEVELTVDDQGIKTIKYKALGAKAFEGQVIAAEVAVEITKTVREVLPEIVSEAVSAALGTKAINDLGSLLSTESPEPIPDQ